MSDPDRDQEIHCEHKPSPAKLDVLGIDHWPLWRKEVSAFPWRYAKTETCYILRGRFRVTPEGGEPREFKRGDLITFPAGLACAWEVLEPVEKHYRLNP
ncbi:MAG: cupin domain-containing protein [Chromatiaceae bacterium]